VVIAEGVGALSRHLVDVWDLTVWVEAPSGVRLQRGVARDGEESRRQWTDVWMPEEDAYVDAERPDLAAEIVIDGTQPLPP